MDESMGCLTFIIGVIITAVGFSIVPQYGVWSSHIRIKQAQYEGEAKLAEANQSRQVKIAEAKATKESAQYYADTQVIKAQGDAKANEIVGESLKNHHEYLMYLYIQNMHQTKNQVIYIPTEGGLPVLEAGRFAK